VEAVKGQSNGQFILMASSTNPANPTRPVAAKQFCFFRYFPPISGLEWRGRGIGEAAIRP
jgi:hypothetical protein